MSNLVTGATGFVGSAVVRALLARGDAVRVLVRRGSDRANLAGLDVEPVEGDLTDPASLARAVAGCARVFHLAADYRIWVPDPQAMLAANVGGTTSLMLAAADAGVSRIVYCSSVAALGLTKDGTPADETTEVSEATVVGTYKKSKFRAEQAVLDLVRMRGLPAVIVNPAAPVGPRDIKPTPTGKMIADAATGRMPAYVETGLNIVHVDDVAAGHLLAAERGMIGETETDVVHGDQAVIADGQVDLFDLALSREIADFDHWRVHRDDGRGHVRLELRLDRNPVAILNFRRLDRPGVAHRLAREERGDVVRHTRQQ